jgi:hypothetical protein
MTTARLGPTGPTAPDGIRLTRWGMFGSVVLVVLGGINVINGFSALHNSTYFTHQILYDNLTFWGWAFIVWGILQLVAGGLVLMRQANGYYIGVCVAGTAAILWFFMLFAAPIQAMLGVIVSMTVVYALTVGSQEAF